MNKSICCYSIVCCSSKKKYPSYTPCKAPDGSSLVYAGIVEMLGWYIGEQRNSSVLTQIWEVFKGLWKASQKCVRVGLKICKLSELGSEYDYKAAAWAETRLLDPETGFKISKREMLLQQLQKKSDE